MNNARLQSESSKAFASRCSGDMEARVRMYCARCGCDFTDSDMGAVYTRPLFLRRRGRSTNSGPGARTGRSRGQLPLALN